MAQNRPQKYKDLTCMMSSCPQANSFFQSLPDYVQSSIWQRGNHIHTEQELKNYADNLLRGDG